MTLHNELKQQTQTHGQRGHGRYEFLARRSEIKRALENGYTAKEVWTLLHEKGTMPIQYRTFIDYVNRYLKKSGQPQTQRAKKPTQLSPKKAESPKKKAENKTAVKQHGNQFTKRFKFDVKGKRKEDLI